MPGPHKKFIRFLSLNTALLIFFSNTGAALCAPAPISAPEALVPGALGHVEESHKGDPDKKIFFILDAHDSLEAQLNISELISRLTAAGVKTVLEEGFEGPVPTDKYFGSIEDLAARRAVSFFLLDQLRIGGAEFAHINRENDFKLVGADHGGLHRANVQAYREASLLGKETARELREMKGVLLNLANERFSPALKEWMKLKEKLDAGKLGFPEYVKRAADRVLQGLSPQEFETLYPALAVLLRGLKNKNTSMEGGRPEIRKALAEVLAMERRFAESELQGDSDRGLFEALGGIGTLIRLNSLELSSEEFAVLRETFSRVRTEKLLRLITGITGRSKVLPRRWEMQIRKAVRFYEIAAERDQAAVKRLESFLSDPSETSAVLVFGGFHKEGLKQFLLERNVSYEIIVPNIGELDPRHQGYYKKLMTEGLHDYEPAPGPGDIPAGLEDQAARPVSILSKWEEDPALARSELRILQAALKEAGPESMELLRRKIEDMSRQFPPEYGPDSVRSELRSLEKTSLWLKDLFPPVSGNLPLEQIVLVSDNTQTLVEVYGDPLEGKILENLRRLLAHPGFHFIVNSGDPMRDLSGKTYPPLIDFLDESGKSRVHIAADGGSTRAGFGTETAYASRLENWPFEERVKYARTLAGHFYDQLKKRQGALADILREVDDSAIDEIKKEYLGRFDALNPKDWEQAVTEHGKFVFKLLPPELEALIDTAYIYDVGPKVSLVAAGMRKRKLAPLDFTREIREKIRDEFGPDRQGIFYSVSGPGYVDLAKTSKVEGVYEIGAAHVIPKLDPQKPVLVVVIGDSSNDIPTFGLKLSGLPGARVLPVFLSHDPAYAGMLPPHAGIAPEANLPGSEYVLDFLAQAIGKPLNEIPALELLKHAEGRKEGIEGARSEMRSASSRTPGLPDLRLEKERLETEFHEIFKDRFPDLEPLARRLLRNTDYSLAGLAAEFIHDYIHVSVPYTGDLYKMYAALASLGEIMNIEKKISKDPGFKLLGRILSGSPDAPAGYDPRDLYPGDSRTSSVVPFFQAVLDLAEIPEFEEILARLTAVQLLEEEGRAPRREFYSTTYFLNEADPAVGKLPFVELASGSNGKEYVFHASGNPGRPVHFIDRSSFMETLLKEIVRLSGRDPGMFQVKRHDALRFFELYGEGEIGTLMMRHAGSYFEPPAAWYQKAAETIAPGGRIVIALRPDMEETAVLEQDQFFQWVREEASADGHSDADMIVRFLDFTTGGKPWSVKFGRVGPNGDFIENEAGLIKDGHYSETFVVFEKHSTQGTRSELRTAGERKKRAAAERPDLDVRHITDFLPIDYFEYLEGELSPAFMFGMFPGETKVPEAFLPAEEKIRGAARIRENIRRLSSRKNTGPEETARLYGLYREKLEEITADVRRLAGETPIAEKRRDFLLQAALHAENFAEGLKLLTADKEDLLDVLSVVSVMKEFALNAYFKQRGHEYRYTEDPAAKPLRIKTHTGKLSLLLLGLFSPFQQAEKKIELEIRAYRGRKDKERPVKILIQRTRPAAAGPAPDPDTPALQNFSSLERLAEELGGTIDFVRTGGIFRGFLISLPTARRSELRSGDVPGDVVLRTGVDLLDGSETRGHEERFETIEDLAEEIEKYSIEHPERPYEISAIGFFTQEDAGTLDKNNVRWAEVNDFIPRNVRPLGLSFAEVSSAVTAKIEESGPHNGYILRPYYFEASVEGARWGVDRNVSGWMLAVIPVPVQEAEREEDEPGVKLRRGVDRLEDSGMGAYEELAEGAGQLETILKKYAGEESPLAIAGVGFFLGGGAGSKLDAGKLLWGLVGENVYGEVIPPGNLYEDVSAAVISKIRETYRDSEPFFYVRPFRFETELDDVSWGADRRQSGWMLAILPVSTARSELRDAAVSPEFEALARAAEIESFTRPAAVFLDAAELIRLGEGERNGQFDELLVFLERHPAFSIYIDRADRYPLFDIKHSKLQKLLRENESRIYSAMPGGPRPDKDSILIHVSLFEDSRTKETLDAELSELKRRYRLERGLLPLEYTRAGELGAFLSLAESFHSAELLRRAGEAYAVLRPNGRWKVSAGFADSFWNRIQAAYAVEWSA